MSINNPPEINQPLYQILSLDIVLGSLSVGLFVVRVLNVSAVPLWWLILPLAVWSVYSFDHLADGFNKKGESKIYRHWFHFNYSKTLIPMVLTTGTIAGILSLVFLDKKIVLFGCGLSFLVLLYFIVVWHQKKLKIKYVQKELFIAIIYISGILLAPAVWNNKPFSLAQLIIFGIMILLAWAEGVIISFYDYENDKADSLKSFAVVYGRKKTRSILITLNICILIITTIAMYYFEDSIIIGALFIELIMNLVLFCLIYFNLFFIDNNYFRWIGESVFILPAFIFLF